MYTHPAVHLRMIKVRLMENFQISAWKYVPFLIKIASLIIAHFAKKDRGKSTPVITLSRRIQHIFNKDPVSPGGVIHQHMSHSAYQLAILNNGAAAHALDDAAGG